MNPIDIQIARPPGGEHQVSAIPCLGIEQRIRHLTAERAELEGDLRDAPPYAQRLIQREIAAIDAELTSLRLAHSTCIKDHYPDLTVRTITVQIDSAQQVMRVAAVVANVAKVDCTQPFKVAISVLLEDWNAVEVVGVSSVVPGGGEVTSPFGAETELRYIDHDPGATYYIDVLADVEYVVAESDKFNNAFHTTWWTLSPEGAKRPTPFKLEVAPKRLAQATTR
jgi:hypothetical protein